RLWRRVPDVRPEGVPGVSDHFRRAAELPERRWFAEPLEFHRRQRHLAATLFQPTAAGAGPASTSCFVTGSTRKLRPSRVREPSSVRSPGSPNTTSSPARFPATYTDTVPVQRSSTVPFARRNRHWLLRSTPNASRTSV